MYTKTMTNMIHAKLHRPVTMCRNGTTAFTLEAGTVVQVDLTHDDLLTVTLGRMNATISMDDASPVEWDADEQMWAEA